MGSEVQTLRDRELNPFAQVRLLKAASKGLNVAVGAGSKITGDGLEGVAGMVVDYLHLPLSLYSKPGSICILPDGMTLQEALELREGPGYCANVNFLVNDKFLQVLNILSNNIIKLRDECDELKRADIDPVVRPNMLAQIEGKIIQTKDEMVDYLIQAYYRMCKIKLDRRFASVLPDGKRISVGLLFTLQESRDADKWRMSIQPSSNGLMTEMVQKGNMSACYLIPAAGRLDGIFKTNAAGKFCCP